LLGLKVDLGYLGSTGRHPRLSELLSRCVAEP
jgi:hypothetical protein